MNRRTGHAKLRVKIGPLVRPGVPFIGAREAESRLADERWAEDPRVRQSGKGLVIADDLAEQASIAALIRIHRAIVALQKPVGHAVGRGEKWWSILMTSLSQSSGATTFA